MIRVLEAHNGISPPESIDIINVAILCSMCYVGE